VEIKLEDLSKEENLYVILKKDFLRDLITEASKEEKPYFNKKFCDYLDISFNKQEKCSLTLRNWLNNQKSIPIKKIELIRDKTNIRWEEIERNFVGIKSGFRGTIANIRFPIKLDKKLGSIVGHILGDGSIDAKYKQVFFSNSNKELLKEFSDNFDSVFNLKPRIWMQKKTIPFKEKTRWEKRLNSIDELEGGKNCGLFYPSVSGALLNCILSNFCIGKEKIINAKIKNTPLEFKIGLIRAFCDDEGTVYNRSIRIFQDKIEILEAIKEFLLEIGITTSKIKHYIKRDKERSYIDIHRKSNLIKFRDKVGLTSPKKRIKLEKASIIRNYKIAK